MADLSGSADKYMREHLYPEQELKSLGQHILLQTSIDPRCPLPSPADRVIGVLIALMAQGITAELDLYRLATEATGAARPYVKRLLNLFNGCDLTRHLWIDDDAGSYYLLSPMSAGAAEWPKTDDAELTTWPADWLSIN